MMACSHYLTESEVVYSRLNLLHRKVTGKVLLYFFRSGYKNRRPNESLSEYYRRKGLKEKLVRKFEKDLTSHQKSPFYLHPDGTNFDVALLYKCLRFHCEGLADQHDDSRWNDEECVHVEAWITRVKDMRNHIVHDEETIFTANELENESQQLQDLLIRILKKCGELYNISADDIKKEINAVVKDIARYKYHFFDYTIPAELPGAPLPPKKKEKKKKRLR